MRNPYGNLNWNSVTQIISTNHWHCSTIDRFWAIYNTGLEHFALTNYLPSYPTYPLTDQPYFSLSEDDYPESILQSPNSEKVKFANVNMHASALGSLYKSPGHNWDVDIDGPFLTWQEKFTLILDDLQYPDGGGVVVNHPNRNAGMTIDRVIEKLRFDDKVLGAEVINHRSERDYDESGYYLDEWDIISSQGIRCFGFFSTDEHNLPPGYKAGEDMRDYNYGLGRNIMLTPNFDSREVLKAYRNGEFYGAFYGDRIRFTDINVINNEFIVKTDSAERIDFFSYSIIDGKKVKNKVITVESNEATFNISDQHIFVRAVAYEDRNDIGYEQPIVHEKIYTQPILFKTEEEIIDEIGIWEEEEEKRKERARKRRKRFLLMS